MRIDVDRVLRLEDVEVVLVRETPHQERWAKVAAEELLATVIKLQQYKAWHFLIPMANQFPGT